MPTVGPATDIAFPELCETAVVHAAGPASTVRVSTSALYTDEQFEVGVTDDDPGGPADGDRRRW